MPQSKITPRHIGKILLVLWLIIATLYVIYGEYNRLRVFVYNRGVSDAVTRIMQEAAKCQAVPLTAGDQKVSIVSLECLQQPEGQEAPVE